MTDATVLADALVEAGILFVPTLDMGKYGGQGQWYSTAEHAITDWRVAGKVLESLPRKHGAEIMRAFSEGRYFSVKFAGSKLVGNLSLPRAIIEAWYGANND